MSIFRRSVLGAAVACAATPWARGSQRFAEDPPVVTEHHVSGGIGRIRRGQFGFTPTSRNQGYGTIPLPHAGLVYMLPLTVTEFDESDGIFYDMRGDGLLTIVKDGIYNLTANLDWPAQPRGSGQDGYDVNLRKLLIRRVPVGVAAPVYTPGEVTAIYESGRNYDMLAAHDTPGASAPNAVRTAIHWMPGIVPPGGIVSRDVALPAGSFVPATTDFVRVTLSSLCDEMLGAANVGMSISARMVAPRMARVVVENRYNVEPVTVPEGTLQLLAESSATTAGNSADAWAYLNAISIRLYAEEKVMVAVRSESQGDFLQIDDASFLRISNVPY